MLKNLGTIDRASRIFLVILFAVLIFTGVVKGAGLVIMSVFSVYFLLTAILAFDPLYTVVGIHTLRTKSGVDD
jgi:hypothetical protein